MEKVKELLGKVMTMLRKMKEEVQTFVQEVVVENGPRYRTPSEWPHLWIDFWNAFFDMNYTLGHIVGIGLPFVAIWEVYKWVSI